MVSLYSDATQVTYDGKTFAVTSIGVNAFFSRNKLTSVTIPGSVNSISEEAFYAIGLKRGANAQVQGSAGITDGWETECRVLLTEYDQWEVQVDVLPKLPVHMVIGMDIISTGNLSLSHEGANYILRFEQL